MTSIQGLISRVRQKVLGQSPLDMVMPPEIVGDEFARIIQEISGDPGVRTALEIGSSSGSGSTASLVAGMTGATPKSLYCLEVSVPRFRELTSRYAQLSWVHCYNLPSVRVEQMPTDADLAAFFASHPHSNVHKFGLSEMQKWLQNDVEYMERLDPGETGIVAARRDSGVQRFDLVLIDGSEFTGEVELEEIYGARYVLLDDTTTFKNYESCERLRRDPAYELLAEDRECRNGFAAFRRVN